MFVYAHVPKCVYTHTHTHSLLWIYSIIYDTYEYISHMNTYIYTIYIHSKGWSKVLKVRQRRLDLKNYEIGRVPLQQIYAFKMLGVESCAG